jgi:hypothetical protein
MGRLGAVLLGCLSSQGMAGRPQEATGGRMSNVLEMCNLPALMHSIENLDIEGARQWVSDAEAKYFHVANDFLQQLGEHEGFPTVEVNARRYMAGKDLGRLTFGTDSGNLRRLIEPYGEKLITLQQLDTEYQVQVNQILGVPKRKDITLATWRHVVIAGLQGKTEFARRIRAYALKVEVVGMVSLAEQVERRRPRVLPAIALLDERLRTLLRSYKNRMLALRGARDPRDYANGWNDMHRAYTNLTAAEIRHPAEAMGVSGVRTSSGRWGKSAAKLLAGMAGQNGGPDFCPAAASEAAEIDYERCGVAPRLARQIAKEKTMPLLKALIDAGASLGELDS